MDASYELILAAINKLRATPAVTALVGTRIYDRVPEKTDGTPNVAFPYISMGPSTSIPDDIDCRDGEEITIQFNVWSSGSGEAFGSVECRKVTGAMKRALHDVDLTLSVNALVSLRYELVRVFRDSNPAITHGVIQFTGTVETP